MNRDLFSEETVYFYEYNSAINIDHCLAHLHKIHMCTYMHMHSHEYVHNTQTHVRTQSHTCNVSLVGRQYFWIMIEADRITSWFVWQRFYLSDIQLPYL